MLDARFVPAVTSRWCVITMIAAGLLSTSCAGTIGKVKNGLYRSPTESYSCRIPFSDSNVDITDWRDAQLEWVRFEAEDGRWIRVDYFALGGDPIASPPPGLSQAERLEMSSARFITHRIEPEFDIERWLLVDTTKIRRRLVRFEVLELERADPPAAEMMGLMSFYHRPNVAIVQLRVAASGQPEPKALVEELREFAEGCRTGLADSGRWAGDGTDQ